MTLHVLNRSPSDRTLFLSCCDALTENDTLLLIEDATYWLLPHHISTLSNVPACVVALSPDCRARGIAAASYTEVDDTGFVELTLKHERTVSWF